MSSRALMLKIALLSGNSSEIYLSIPAPIIDPQIATTYTDNEIDRLRFATRISYWGLARDDIVHELGALNINGRSVDLSAFYNDPFCIPRSAWSTLDHYDLGTRIWRSESTSHQKGELEHRSFTFWADEILCRVVPRAHSSSPVEADAWIDIVKADLRTRQHFLENLHVEPLDQGAFFPALHKIALRTLLKVRFRWH